MIIKSENTNGMCKTVFNPEIIWAKDIPQAGEHIKKDPVSNRAFKKGILYAGSQKKF
ncbi:MAG: hypothetical protein J6M93_05035 [Succinivibrio sp.]|nr:hypothetical protein [Succinivibrio sp.]